MFANKKITVDVQTDTWQSTSRCSLCGVGATDTAASVSKAPPPPLPSVAPVGGQMRSLHSVPASLSTRYIQPVNAALDGV